MDDTAQYLYYSDNPETLSANVVEGVLFDFDVVDAVVQRFLFYHYIKEGAGRCIALRTINLAGNSAVLGYRGSVPTPSGAIMNCGHDATSGFLYAVDSGPWNSVPLGPNAQTMLFSPTVTAGELFNGILEFRVTSGGPVKVSLVVAADVSRVYAVAAGPGTLGNDGHRRIGKFDISDKSPFVLSVDAAGAAVPFKLGERTFPNLDKTHGGGPDVGEYGILSHIRATLVNNTANALQLALYESAHGGPSTGSYVVDGRHVDSGKMDCTVPAPPGYVPPTYKVNVYSLAPNSTATTDIYTIPDSGSSSPIVLTFARNDTTTDPESPTSVVQLDPTPSPSRLV